LSSVLTPIYKFLFPAAFCGGLVLALSFRAWEIALPFAIAALFTLPLASPLKRVNLRGNSIVRSNYFRSCEFSCTNIVEVQEKRQLKVRPVLIFFRTPTPFGTRVAFIPHMGVVPFWRPHPVVQLLRHISQEAALDR